MEGAPSIRRRKKKIKTEDQPIAQAFTEKQIKEFEEEEIVTSIMEEEEEEDVEMKTGNGEMKYFIVSPLPTGIAGFTILSIFTGETLHEAKEKARNKCASNQLYSNQNVDYWSFVEIDPECGYFQILTNSFD